MESWKESIGRRERSGIGKGPRGGIRTRVAVSTVALYVDALTTRLWVWQFKKHSKLKSNMHYYSTLKSLISYLSFDVDFLRCMFVEPLHVNLTVKVANVADDGVVLHLVKVSVKKKRHMMFILPDRVNDKDKQHFNTSNGLCACNSRNKPLKEQSRTTVNHVVPTFNTFEMFALAFFYKLPTVILYLISNSPCIFYSSANEWCLKSWGFSRICGQLCF